MRSDWICVWAWIWGEIMLPDKPVTITIVTTSLLLLLVVAAPADAFGFQRIFGIGSEGELGWNNQP